MKTIDTYKLDEYFNIKSGNYPQSRNTIVNVYAEKLDGVAVVQLIARWEVNTLQDWQPNMDAIRAVADQWQKAHNTLVKKYNSLADQYGVFDHEGYEIALAEHAVLINGADTDEIAMKADFLAFSPSTGEWAPGRLYWRQEHDQPYELDLEALLSDPEDLEAIFLDLD